MIALPIYLLITRNLEYSLTFWTCQDTAIQMSFTKETYVTDEHISTDVEH